VCVQQEQWLDVVSRQQEGSYDVEMSREEQEILDYSYRESVINSFVELICIISYEQILLFLETGTVKYLGANKGTTKDSGRSCKMKKIG